MRMKYTSLLTLAAPLLFGAAPPAAVVGLPSYDQPARAWSNVESAQAERRCRDRIEEVRKDMGKPRIERAPADAAKPILQYAVDRRIDGCGVLVPVADPAAVMPPPEVGEPEVIPATPGAR